MASQIGFEPTAFRLGGEPSIQLRYWDLRKIMSRPVAEPLPLRRRLLYPAELRKHIQFTYFLRIFIMKQNVCLQRHFAKPSITRPCLRGDGECRLLCVLYHTAKKISSPIYKIIRIRKSHIRTFNHMQKHCRQYAYTVRIEVRAKRNVCFSF